MATAYDVVHQPTYTRDGNDGFPPECEFDSIVFEYITALNPRKREKALMTQAMYESILSILINPNNTRDSTAQFRFWTKKMFRLVTTPHVQIVTHENRPVAVKEQIYDVLVQCHAQCSHGGRDKTSNQVRRYYSWIPKELIARFVKACPTCYRRRCSKAGSGGERGTYYAEGSSPCEAYTSDSGNATPSYYSLLSRPTSAADQISYFPPMPPAASHVPVDLVAMAEWTEWLKTSPQRQQTPLPKALSNYHEAEEADLSSNNIELGILSPRTIELVNSWCGDMPASDLSTPSLLFNMSGLPGQSFVSPQAAHEVNQDESHTEWSLPQYDLSYLSTKSRARPHALDLRSFSNLNVQPSNDFLSAFPSHISGSVSAPAHMTSFLEPALSLFSPNLLATPIDENATVRFSSADAPGLV